MPTTRFISTSRELGAALRAERKARGLTLQQVADKVSLRRQTVAALESGENASLHTVMAVLAVLGMGLHVIDRLPGLLDEFDLSATTVPRP